MTADNKIDGEYDTQGWNRYSYVKNGPVNYKDPTGNIIFGTIEGAKWGTLTGLVQGGIEGYHAYKNGSSKEDVANIVVSKTIAGAVNGAITGATIELAIEVGVGSDGSLSGVSLLIAGGGGALGEYARCKTANAILNKNNSEYKEEVTAVELVKASVINSIGLGSAVKAKEAYKSLKNVQQTPIKTVREGQASQEVQKALKKKAIVTGQAMNGEEVLRTTVETEDKAIKRDNKNK